MVRKMLCLIMLSFSLAIGGLWGLRAQEQTPQKPQTPQTPATMPQTTSTSTSQIDLSGTYTGTFNCEAAGLVGDTTLTINGNEFTTADGRTGRITTSKTKSYTAVALQVNGADVSKPSTIISLRAKKSGNKLTLTPIAGATQKCTFVPAKNVAKGRTTPPATGTEVANPAPAQTPSPSPTPSASPTPTPSPTPSGSPTPMPSPMPTPTPSPGEPTPTPSPSEPMPSPTPSPTPTPGI
jgi:hypothetical protein